MRWLFVVLVVAGSAAVSGQSRPESIAFSRDVAPIISERCAGCHRDGGDAPFSLASYEDVRRRAATIRAVVGQRYMPPWKPAGAAGDFEGDRRLSDREINLLSRWIDAGAPLGAPGAAQAAGRPESRLPPPDLLLSLPDYELRADGPDVFRNFVVPVPTAGRRYVRGLRFTPRGGGVHHANIRVDPTAASAQLDASDPTPGYEGLVLRSADFPDGHFLGWTPGQLEPVLSDDTAWRLEPGSSLVVQLHLRPTGKVERIAPAIALYFGERAPVRVPSMLRLGRQNLSIPAGSANHVVSDSFVLPVDVEVRAVQPHAHYRARTVHASARRPDGTERELIRIDDWDVNWQDRYSYAKPFWLPAGTTLTLRFTFDNSAANVRNPIAPPQHAGWGWRSIDEMADLWIQVMTRSDDDRRRLESAARAKMLAEDAIGSEQILTREPNHADLHNDVALIYMSLGEPAKALAHFAAVRRIRPDSAAALYNEGVALEAVGERDAAAVRYRDAIARAPDYGAALNNLGALLLAANAVREARDYLERAVAVDPANVEARANLATILIATADLDGAVQQMQSIVTAGTPRARAIAPLLILLAAHPDPSMRRPKQARLLVEQLLTHAGGDAAVLDAWAVTLAAEGDFDAAIRSASDALDALRDAKPGERSAMQERLSLYRSGRPFILPRPRH